MGFQYGDRVRMIRHGDWKNDAFGMVVSARTHPTTLPDGSTDVWYWIEFDEPQRDETDELNGRNLDYRESTVLGRFLRPASGPT